ncbi:MAG TPA: hypothetical protein EYN67_12265 [Flavobacteriales bacterium]|nr:hypothetical protein [Flavobacteriales bacterium]
MSPTRNKAGGPNYKGHYQQSQITLMNERQKIVELNTETIRLTNEIEAIKSDYRRLMQDNLKTMKKEEELILGNKEMFKWTIIMALTTIAVLIFAILK